MYDNEEYFSLLSVLSKGKCQMTEQAPLSGFAAVDMEYWCGSAS